MVVQKYGGSSLENAERIRNVAERIKGRVDSREKVIVVVSAMGKTTNDLISLAENLSEEPGSQRTGDAAFDRRTDICCPPFYGSYTNGCEINLSQRFTA
jgi:Aspartokinases